MLISVHLPKTAGTSFERGLRGHFGEQLQLDYEAKPLHHSPLRRRVHALTGALRRGLQGHPDAGIRCIHGHFLPLGYRWLRATGPVSFVTWLRDPVERLASHYHHWRRVDDPPSSDTLHLRMLEEAWSFEDFALRPELRNIYSQFLWGFPLERFSFVGISEHYAADLREFGRRVLNSELPICVERRNPDLSGARYAIDATLRERIEAYHGADRALYERALGLREARL